MTLTLSSEENKSAGSVFAPIRGILSLLGYGLNTLFWAIPILFLAFFKRLLPWSRWRRIWDRLQNTMADLWIATNIVNHRVFSRTQWDIHLPGDLDRNGWYLVIANHRSWVDILVLQRVFHRKIPFLKFFLKKELFWLPILGQAWWALDFPFMKRYSKGYLKKHPERIGKDFDITRKACERFKKLPISVMSFVEGTRFSEKKQGSQKSPYRSLLRPRAGGVAYVLSAMNGQLRRVLDVTIVYSAQRISFWDFVCGRISQIRVQVRSLPITEALVGDYARDRAFRLQFQKWLNGLWEQKDACIQELQNKPARCLPPIFPLPAVQPFPVQARSQQIRSEAGESL